MIKKLKKFFEQFFLNKKNIFNNFFILDFTNFNDTNNCLTNAGVYPTLFNAAATSKLGKIDLSNDNNCISNFFNNTTSLNNNYPQIYAPLFAAASNPAAAAAAAAVALFNNSNATTASTSTFNYPSPTSTVNLNSPTNITKYQQQQISALEKQNNFNQQQQQHLQLQRQLLAVAAFKHQFAAALGAASINCAPTLSPASLPNSVSKVEISTENLH